MSDSFNVVCEKLREKFGSDINAEFICMKIEKGSYMWIANVDHEIAVQPVHYEIRVAKEDKEESDKIDKIFVEVHVESENPNVYNEKKQKDNGSVVVHNLTKILKSNFENKEITLVKSTQKNYFWYRRIDNIGFDIDVSSVPAIFDELKKLDEIVGETIRDVIENQI